MAALGLLADPRLLVLVLAIAPDSSAIEWWARLGPVFEEAQAQYARGDYVGAAASYGAAMPANPFACLHNRALCHARHGAWDLASKDLTGAVEMAPTRAQRARALVALGAIRLRLGLIDPAHAALTLAIELGAEGPYPWLNLASVHEARERYREAIDALDRARAVDVERASDDALLDVERASDDALLDVELAEDVAIWRALLAHRLGEEPRLLGIDPGRTAGWASAIERLSRALRLHPDSGAARALLADIAQRAREQGVTEVASAVALVLERDRPSAAPSPRPPLGWLDDEPVPGEPADSTEPSRWEDYAHRWELLVLLGLVLGILAIYLRIKAAKARLAP